MDDFLNNFNCPQYIDFMSEVDHNVTEETLPSCSFAKEKPEHMVTEDGSSYLPEESKSEILSESYLNNCSNQKSIESVSSVSLQAKDFPVHCFENNLSENAPKNNSKGNKTVKGQFHLMEGKKRKREDEHIPLAEQVIAFHKKTPQRFHTIGSKAFEPMEHWSPPIINPKSPNLRAVKRMRGVNVLSREEQEEKEAEEIKGYKFHARPFHQSILQQPKLIKIGRKTPTKPKGFNLRTAQRAAEIHARKKMDEKPYEFHARPIPKAILNGPIGVKEKLSLPVTEPKTPNFALKSRAEKWKSEEKLNSTTLEKTKFKALPAPVPTAPFLPKHEKKQTEIQPFSFDSKDKERIAKKEEKIMKEIEKENAVYVFRAQGMPSPTPSSLPIVNKKPPTLPQPFSFHSETRSFQHSSFSSSLDQTCPVFKAQPAKVLEKPPFVPEKSDKQPVEVKEFHLHTDIRASERQKLKEINDMKERENERVLQELRRLKEEEERREIARLRKEAVHKANPIKHYKPVEIKPSDKDLTVPVSPKFKTNERLQMRH